MENSFRKEPRCPFCERPEEKKILKRPLAGNDFCYSTPNDFPALELNSGTVRGKCEIIIESDYHYRVQSDNGHLLYNPLMHGSIEEVYNILGLAHQRAEELESIPGISYVGMFKNQGKSAGGSQPHPHQQLWAIAIVPQRIQYMVQRLRSKNCCLCHGLKNSKRTIIFQNRHIVCQTVESPEFHYQTMVMPKEHIDNWGSMDEDLKVAISKGIKEALNRIEKVVGEDFDYNLIYHRPPKGVDDYHYHLELLPRLNIKAGFEYLTGLNFVSVGPEYAALEMRNTGSG